METSSLGSSSANVSRWREDSRVVVPRCHPCHSSLWVHSHPRPSVPCEFSVDPPAVIPKEKPLEDLHDAQGGFPTDCLVRSTDGLRALSPDSRRMKFSI